MLCPTYFTEGVDKSPPPALSMNVKLSIFEESLAS